MPNAIPWPEQAAITGLGKEKILDRSLKPLEVIFFIFVVSPDAITFKSNPAENIPARPVIIKDPLSVGTLSRQSFMDFVISSENTLALPSSSVIIEMPFS